MCSSGCCCWSANEVWRWRLRKLSPDDLDVSESTTGRPADAVDVTLCKSTLCKSPSLGRVAMVETGLVPQPGCGKLLSDFATRFASKRVDR